MQVLSVLTDLRYKVWDLKLQLLPVMNLIKHLQYAPTQPTQQGDSLMKTNQYDNVYSNNHLCNWEKKNVHLYKGGHILVEVDVHHACFFLAADHKRLVKSFELVTIQTLAPLTIQPPDPFIHCVHQLPISLVHFLPRIILWHETDTLQDLKSHIITQIWPYTNTKYPVYKQIYVSTKKHMLLSEWTDAQGNGWSCPHMESCMHGS